ncbi:MAG: hypothetical protein UBAL2_79310411 [Leptospirillum rubarum]|nr:MAG: hypothetical protein UBAL2_79310411 [Leptospirillum rubarum]
MTRFARTLDYPDELSWLPDWRDASQYPPVEGTSGTRWAWEFLRRNPEYQKAYSELTHVVFHGHRYGSRGPAPILSWKVDGKDVLVTRGAILMARQPPSDEAIMEETRRLFNICERFHLIDGVRPPDPRSNEDPRLSFRAAWMRSYHHNKKHPGLTSSVPEGKILIEFDLDLSLEIQFKHAKEILKRAGVPAKEKYQPEKFPSYLRILDARTEEDPLSFEKIGKIVYPESSEPGSTSWKAYKIARLLRNSLFWKIPLLVD